MGLAENAWAIFGDMLREQDAKRRGVPYKSELRTWVETYFREHAQCQPFSKVPSNRCRGTEEHCR